MLIPFTLAAVSLLSTAAPAFSTNTQDLFSKYGSPKELPPFSVIQEFPTPVAVREVEKPKRLICKSCNNHENSTLAFLQDQGITDRNALATIMGNIRQESTFVPEICEGGSRTGYHNCGGGFGLLQWTNAPRYYGLGQHARSIGANPSSLRAQLSYLVSESDWKMVEHRMKAPGRSIESYMSAARDWIRWGHHGARTSYAYDYVRRFTLG
jgi:hypothetical protein